MPRRWGPGAGAIVRRARRPTPTPGAAAGPTPDPDRGLVLEPNPYARPAPLLRRLWFRFYPTAGALLTAFDQREIDGVSVVEPAGGAPGCRRAAMCGCPGRTCPRPN